MLDAPSAGVGIIQGGIQSAGVAEVLRWVRQYSFLVRVLSTSAGPSGFSTWWVISNRTARHFSRSSAFMSSSCLDRTGEEPAFAAVASACDPIETSAPGLRGEALGGAPRREQHALQRGECAADLVPAVIGGRSTLAVDLRQQPAAIRAALHDPAGGDGADEPRRGMRAP